MATPGLKRSANVPEESTNKIVKLAKIDSQDKNTTKENLVGKKRPPLIRSAASTSADFPPAEEVESTQSDNTSEEPPFPSSSPTPSTEEPMPRLPASVCKPFEKPPGALLIAGKVAWEMVGGRGQTSGQHPNLYTFHRFTNIEFRLAVSSCSAAHSILITSTGAAYAFGRNNCGQLGLGDKQIRYEPVEIPALKGIYILTAAVGKQHTLFLTDTGVVYACGDNRFGQCGIGSVATEQLLEPTKIKYRAPIMRVACGAEFSIILDVNSRLYSFGHPEHGQLGHNSDRKYFVTSSEFAFHFVTSPKLIDTFVEKLKDGRVTAIKDADIIEVVCGNNHTVAYDSKGRAYSWGFGGFGRLGHSLPKDEFVPRLIKFFGTQNRGVRAIFAGAAFSLAINESGSLYLFGQNKRSSEANMYPKLVQELKGRFVRTLGASNTSIVVAADDTLVVWGTSPTYGELGIGELNKSSSKPKEVIRMEGLNLTHVTMGFSHTLLISNNSTEAVKEKLQKLPVFKP